MSDHLLPAGTKQEMRPSNRFAILLAIVQLIVVVLYTFTNDPSESMTAFSPQLYNYYIGVSLMMFVGFGYLMTFLRWYGLGAVGFTMLITALGVEVAMLAEPLFTHGALKAGVVIDMMALLNANFAVAAFLISFGGIIGKVGPTQLVVMVVFEAIFYAANKQMVLMPGNGWLPVVDCGGTIIIHMFGAYFGLAASYVLGNPNGRSLDPREKNSISSDVTSLLGTVVLWVYWPSFVASPLQGVSNLSQSNLALTNTVLALLASTIMAFIVSALFNEGFIRPVDIQNATLSGGVAIGCLANLAIKPVVALLVGSIAGAISTVGFCRVQPFLLESIGLHDSCGIHNLHGMPSIIGALFSIAGQALASGPAVPYAATAGKPLLQLGGMAATLVVAILTGAFTGYVMRFFKEPASAKPLVADDRVYWDVADNFAKEDEDV